MSTKRQSQTAELVKRNMSIVLMDQGIYIYGSEILVSVTNVVMSRDLGQAKIYLSVFNAQDKEEVVKIVNAHNARLKQVFYHRIRKHIRRMPLFTFYLDNTLDEMEKFNEIFDSIKP